MIMVSVTGYETITVWQLGEGFKEKNLSSNLFYSERTLIQHYSGNKSVSLYANISQSNYKTITVKILHPNWVAIIFWHSKRECLSC